MIAKDAAKFVGAANVSFGRPRRSIRDRGQRQFWAVLPGVGGHVRRECCDRSNGGEEPKPAAKADLYYSNVSLLKSRTPTERKKVVKFPDSE